MMRRPRIDDRQLDVLAERLATIRVGRRDFLALAAGLAAEGPLVRPATAALAPHLAPGEKLAKEQVFRYGGGGWWPGDPTSHDFNKDMFCDGVPALFAGLLKFDADHLPVSDLATSVTSDKDGARWVFTLRRDSKWSDGTPCTARDFEWSWKRQLDPATASPYATFFYDLKNGEAFNKKRTDASQVGVRARDEWTLEATLEGPRAYFPILAAFLAALPAHRRAVEKHGDRWTEAANIVCNGPFVLERWEHNKVMVLRKNPHFYGASGITLQKAVIPIIPTAAGALPYENHEIDMTSLQPSDLRRLQSNAATAGQVFPYPFPGTWYLIPQVTRPPFDNLNVRRAVAHAIDRANLVKVAQGFALPAHAMIPPGFPGATDDPKIKALQRFDPKLAMAQLKGTPFAGGRNWPRITLTMRDEARGSRPLAQAVQAVLLEHLNMHTELEVLDPACSASGCGSTSSSSCGSAGSWITRIPTTSTSTPSTASAQPGSVRPGATRRSTGSWSWAGTPVIRRSDYSTTSRPRRSSRATSPTSPWPGWSATPRSSPGSAVCKRIARASTQWKATSMSICCRISTL
jgi:ABC-type oligopeptide transport system substrate-binding subunit